MQHLFLECALRAALIAAGTGAVLEILQVRTARARHRAWGSVVLMMLVLPVWTAWGPKALVPVLPAVASRGANPAISPVNASSGYAPPTEINLERPELPSGWAAWNWWTCVASFYLLGVAALLARLAFGTVRAHLLVRRAFHREGRLTSSLCAAPVTVGWLRPSVILPECWREWPEEQLEAVLTHESEHARRRDPLVEWLAVLNRAIFWFHPLAWWLQRRLSGLAEEACDAAVLARGHDPYKYSGYLVEIARAVERSGARLNVWGMAMPGSYLAKRIRQILEGRPAPRLTRVRMASAACACAFLSAVFAAGAVDHRRSQPVIMSESVDGGQATRDVRVSTPAAPQPIDTRTRPVPRAAQLLAQVQTSPPASATTATSEQALKDRRHLVMYFDMAELKEADAARAVDAIQKLIRFKLQPDDLLAIMEYRGGSIRVLQDFSDDRDRLAQTLDQLIGDKSPNSGTVSNLDGQSMVLRKAIQLLEPLDGKKVLIHFTAGASRPPDSQAETKETLAAAQRTNVAIYVIDARGLVAR